MKSSSKIVLLLGRDNWQKDDYLNKILVTHLKAMNYEIQWEDPAGKIIYYFRNSGTKFINQNKLLGLSFLRFIQIRWALFNWNYFAYLSKRHHPLDRLKSRIKDMNPKRDIIIISRSSGGIIASQLADSLNISKVICLGYPFKHPDKSQESHRYTHLETIKTPMLIIQGINDEYGGSEIISKYFLSSSIEIYFINTNHDFILNTQGWVSVLNKINEYLL